MSGVSNDLVEPRNPLAVALALAQYLLFVGPEGSEWGWRLAGIVGQAEPGQWFAVRGKDHTSYMMAGERGRFSAALPEGVDAGTLPVIDESGPTPTALRGYMDWLAKSIAESQPEYAAKIGAIAQMAWRGDDLGWLRGELSELRSGFGKKPPDMPDAEFCATLASETRRRYLHFEVPGTLAATVLLLTAIARVSAPMGVLHQAFGMGGALDIFDGPERFLLDMLRKIVKIDSGETKIAEAAAALQDEAEALADKAEGVKGVGEFYGSIFESVPLAYAAQQGFEFLAKAGLGKPGNYKMLANVCEERIAPAYATLPLAFRDAMDWRELRWHRAAIADARKTGGDTAAEMLADQYTKLSLLYPIFLRDFLLGKTDVLRLTAASK
jgi:hypothetical protein